jgi:pimeloyl-ACP methyl ester carboxylesterase
MAFATLDGIKTHYVKKGSGPCLLMIAPRGFEIDIAKLGHGKWRDMNAIEALSQYFTVVAYDRREPANRVDAWKFSWKVFARTLLLKHLDIERAFLLGVCMGVGVATSSAACIREACEGLILAHPVGGHRWTIRTHVSSIAISTMYANTAWARFAGALKAELHAGS